MMTEFHPSNNNYNKPFTNINMVSFTQHHEWIKLLIKWVISRCKGTMRLEHKYCNTTAAKHIIIENESAQHVMWLLKFKIMNTCGIYSFLTCIQQQTIFR